MWRTVLRSTWLITQGFARRMQNGESYAFFYRRFIQLIGLVLAMKTDGITCPPIGNFIGTAADYRRRYVDDLLKADNEKERSLQKRKRDRDKVRKKVAGAGEDDYVRQAAQRSTRNAAAELRVSESVSSMKSTMNNQIQ